MDFKTDIYLKHSAWHKKEDLVKNENLRLFKRDIDLYVVACTLGVAADKTLENDLPEVYSTIGRNTIQTNYDINDSITFLYQNAILNTKTINLDLDKRKKYAFENDIDDSDYNPSIFLTKFANYGMSKLAECITNNDIETIVNIVQLIRSNGLTEDLDVEEIIL